MKPLLSSAPTLTVAFVLISAFAGCTHAPSAGEKQARANVSQLGETLRPARAKPVLPRPRQPADRVMP